MVVQEELLKEIETKKKQEEDEKVKKEHPHLMVLDDLSNIMNLMESGNVAGAGFGVGMLYQYIAEHYNDMFVKEQVNGK